MMRKQVKKRSTVNKYKIEGPIHWEGDYVEEDDEDDEDHHQRDSANGESGNGFSGWFLTQTPEWLPQLNATDTSGTEGTQSPDDEAFV